MEKNEQATPLIERPAAPKTEPNGSETKGNDGYANRAGNGAPSAPSAAPHASAPEAAEEPAKTPGRPWVKPLLLLALAVALVFAAIWGVGAYRFSSTHAATDDAYITSDVVQITPQVAGNLTRVLVEDNQLVQQGQLLAELDNATYKAAVEQAQADLAQAKAGAVGASYNVRLTGQTGSAQVEQANGGVSQAESAIASAQAEVARTQAVIANAQAAEQSSIATADAMRAALQSAISSRQRALEAVRGAQAQVATAQAAVRSAQASVNAAQANSDKAAKDLQRYQALYRDNAISAQQLDAARAAADTATAQLEAAQQQVSQARETVNARQSDVSSAQDAVHIADSNISQARSQVAAAQSGVRQAQANIRTTQAQRNSALSGVGQAQANLTKAQGQLSQARTTGTQVSVSKANQQTANAHIMQAQAALDNALINLRRTQIVAPVAGTISKKSGQVGQQVAVGQAIMAIIPKDDLWVVGNFKETQMREVRPGEPADVEVDTLPGITFHGHVDSIAAGTGATFSLLPPDNATGNFTKVVQRVPVKVVLDPGQKDMDRLRAGLSVVVTIKTK